MSLEPRRIPSKSSRPLFLPEAEVGRIAGMIGSDARRAREAEAAAEASRRLGETSRRMAAEWPNTFANQHQQRLENAAVRKRQEEEKKVAAYYRIDQANDRREKEVMNTAWRRLYEQTDRVKRLQQAINLSDALTQRRRQVAVKQKRGAAFDRLDEEYLKGMLRDVAQHECELVDEGRRERDNRRRNADNWNRQRQQVEERRKREAVEHHKMGFQIRDEASRYEEEADREKQEQWQRKLEFRKILDDEVETKHALRDIERSMEEADQKRAEVFQEAKRKMALQRKENFREAEKAREEKAAKMRTHLIEQRASSKNKEDENMKKAVTEKEQQLRQQEREKAARQEEAQAGIQRFYESKVKAKEEARVEDYRRRFREGKALRDTADHMYKVEEAKEARWEAGEKDGQHVQLHQIAHNRQKRQLAKMEEMNDYMRHMRELDGEEELFQKYAKMRLEECERKGMITYPVQVAARPGIECGKGPLLVDRAHVRPKYYAAVADPDELHVVERSKAVLDTKSRLGFIH